MPADATPTEPLCPHCLEPVNPKATRCRHCGSDLGSKPDQSATTITYVVDRGLIRYGKFALGVLAIFVVFGTYVFGFDISNLVKEMRALRTQIAKETTDLNETQTRLDTAMTKLATSQTAIEKAKDELDQTRKTLEQAKVALAGIETQTQEISQRTKTHLVSIEAHLTKAGFLVASIEERHEQSLTTEQQVLADAARTELSVATGSVAARDGKLWPVGQRLTVRFLEGTEEQKALVENAVKAWEEHANIAFDFVSGRVPAEIRIAFRHGDGTWSYVGTDALALPQSSPTMNFGFDLTTPNGHDVILSEFGHALGLLNEHQNPTDPIPWDEDAVVEYYSGAPLHWDRDLIEHNILRRASAEDYPGERPFDPNSIMTYSFPAGLIDSERYRAGLSPTPGLSESDKTYVAALYPSR